jgi:hypothetical protein
MRSGQRQAQRGWPAQTQTLGYISLDTAPKNYRYTQPSYTCARASTALPAQALRAKTAQPSRLASLAAAPG